MMHKLLKVTFFSVSCLNTKAKLAKNLSKIKNYYDSFIKNEQMENIMRQPIALVTDFDGTITDDDFFTLVAKKYLSPFDLAPWNDYMNGNLSHFDALNKVFAKISIPEQELITFIKTIALDSSFAKTAIYCYQKEIPLYICSAGCDYYINLLIGKLIKQTHINLITNKGEYTPQTGLIMQAPCDSIFYDEYVGISKSGVVKYLQDQGYEVIFCGDGPPDVAPAKIAQTVFAKKYLRDKCLEYNISIHKFNSFTDVLTYLKEI